MTDTSLTSPRGRASARAFAALLWAGLTALLPGALAAQTPTTPARPAARLQPAPAQQETSQEELIARREAKLAKPVFTRAPWIMDFAAAKAKARANDQLILVYFTRSYAY